MQMWSKSLKKSPRSLNISSLKWCSLINCNWCVSLDISSIFALKCVHIQHLQSIYYMSVCSFFNNAVYTRFLLEET